MWAVSVFLICMTCFPGIFSIENRGKLFITAFPENVAFYDPVPHNCTLYVTAVTDDTAVTVTVGSAVTWQSTLAAAATNMVPLDRNVELDRSQFSPKSVVIRSTKDVTVLSRTERTGTVQVLVLQPVNSLGTYYYIPSGILPGFADFNDARAKIVIINSEESNNVQLHFSGENTEKQALKPFGILQFNITDSLPISISADHNMVMLLTHPCAEITLCKCQMVVTQLQPINNWGTTFLVPNEFTSNNTDLLLTSNQSITFNNDIGLQLTQAVSNIQYPISNFVQVQNQYLSSSSYFSAMLVQPGFTIDLIPESSFSACYFVPKSLSSSMALVIAPTSNRSQVRLGKEPQVHWSWQAIDSQPYSWAVFDLMKVDYNIIWHPSTKIGVYVNYGENWSRAISIATEPAPEGCLVAAKSYRVIGQLGTWAEAIGLCQQEGSEFVSINNGELLQELSEDLSNPSNEKEVWLGLRRRLLNGDWYWLNKLSLNVTRWADGQPGSDQTKYCASMSLSSEAKENLLWNSKSCCDKLKPVCVKGDIYFPYV